MKSSKNTSKVRSTNIQHGFQPIYYYSRCIGRWPFTIAYNSNGSIKEVRVHLFDIFWFFISNCLYLAVLFFVYEEMIWRFHALSSNSYFNYVIFYVSQIPTLLFGTIFIVLDMLNRKILVDILDKFIIFDKEV